MDKAETPGQRYLRYRRLELQEFLRYARSVVANYRHSLETYKYAEDEKERVQRALAEYESEIRYTEKELAEMGGAENEDTEILTETTVPESPQLSTKLGCILGR